MQRSFFFILLSTFNFHIISANNHGEDTTRVFEYCDLSYSYLLKNQDSAIYYGQLAVDLSKKIKFDKGLAQAFNDLGLVYYYQSDYSKASELWLSSLEIRLNIKDSLGVAALFNKLGALVFQLGELDQSLDYQFSALRIYEGVNHQEGIAKGYNNIASVYEQQGHFDKALEYYENAIKIKLNIEDYLEVGGSMLNVASIYLRKKELIKSRAKYLEAIILFEQYGFENTVYSGAAFNNLSRVYLEMDSLDQARNMAIKSIEIRTNLGDQQGLVSCKNRIGMIDLKNKNYDAAKRSLIEGAQLAEKFGLKKEARDSYELLSELHRELSDFKNALYYTDLFYARKDTILNQASIQSMAMLQTQYETEKKEQTIALQKLELAERKAQNQRNNIAIFTLVFSFLLLMIVFVLFRSRTRKKQELLLKEAQILLREAQIESALNSQESERKRFARDLHDGFGQMISVLNLNLKSLEKDNSDREEVFQSATKVLDEMYKELKGICFNLMPETLIKNGVVDAIKEFSNRVNQTGKIVITVDTFGITDRLSDLQEISIYRITQEWINNMLKYSDADKVTISLTKDEEEITLLIEDNGAGFDKQNLINGSGNGWKNMNSRANLIKGELELETTKGVKGNTLIVNAPVRLISSVVKDEIPV